MSAAALTRFNAKSIGLSKNADMDKQTPATGCFSPNYSEARERLLNAAADVQAKVTSHVSPEVGPDGETLAVDVVEIGNPSAEGALIICSGTHGVEGFAGSAIQLSMLRSPTPTDDPHAPRLVLIHGLNPYGFAWLRRFNEDNVDLNRNFLAEDAAYPENRGYETLASAICPKSISAFSNVYALARLFLYAGLHGVADTREAVTGGQYSHPEGLFYGGRKPSWSARTLKAILRDQGKNTKEVVFLDIHTGLGAFASAEIVLNSPKNSPEFRRAVSIWGEDVKTTKAAEAVSADLSGTLKLALPGMLPEAEVTAASIEFGTYPSLRVLWAMRAENWLHHYGNQNTARGRKIKEDLLTAFDPDDETWRTEVLRKGLDAAERAIEWLSSGR